MASTRWIWSSRTLANDVCPVTCSRGGGGGSGHPQDFNMVMLHPIQNLVLKDNYRWDDWVSNQGNSQELALGMHKSARHCVCLILNYWGLT